MFTLMLASQVALAELPPPDVRYRHMARAAVWGGLASATVPPLATGIGVYLSYKSTPPPPTLMGECRGAHPIVAIGCVIFFPVILIADAVVWSVWAVGVVAVPLAITSPLYSALPLTLNYTAGRARRALLDVGEATPGGWSKVGWTMYGLHLGSMFAAAGSAAGGAGDAAGVFAATSVLTWGGAVTAGVAQWSVDRKHARAAGIAGPDREDSSREVFIPLFSWSGRF